MSYAYLVMSFSIYCYHFLYIMLMNYVHYGDEFCMLDMAERYNWACTDRYAWERLELFQF